MCIKNPIAPCICCYTTLWNINVRAKQAINAKLKRTCSVAAYLRCGGVVNNQVRKGLLLSMSVNFLKSVYIWQLQTRTWLSCALSSSFSSVLANYKFTKESSSDFLKSVKIWQNYGNESVAPLFWPTLYIGWSDVTESTVMIRSPFCGHKTMWCVGLNGEDLSCYSNKIESVSLRKCQYDHWLTNKAYLKA